MNLPNILTISRFFLIPVFVIVFFLGHEMMAFGVFLLAGVTDMVDGYLARKYNLITELGIMLDPLADKLMTLTVFVSLLITEKISWLVAGIVFFRDAGMIISSVIFHFKGKKTVPANFFGKMTTVLFYIAILMIIFELPYRLQFLWFVVVFSFITSIKYILEFIKLNKQIELQTKGAIASHE